LVLKFISENFEELAFSKCGTNILAHFSTNQIREKNYKKTKLMRKKLNSMCKKNHSKGYKKICQKKLEQCVFSRYKSFTFSRVY
jgi:hypothetical protein